MITVPPFPSQSSYRVLARQYRPQKLSELVGQDMLVKTLSHSIERGRMPHAVLLHGIRGVGKTTTARILAKAMNCTGADGQDGPTPNPCGVCEDCIAIASDRHLDVVEMDAASRTGVDDVREVIEAARYKAVKGRYKFYIIDEVHMLSKSAFNALLKTLEEPPPHVIFVFATTEIRKIPETVQSRCMRFDLNRIEPKCLFDHFNMILQKENLTIAQEALSLIVRAADGPVRDGLSLLDQAIALSGGAVTSETVRAMLGLIDRGQIFTLLQNLLTGEVSKALTHVRDLYQQGGDPVVLMENLLELTYWLTCLKTAPQLQNDVTWPESDRVQGSKIIENLPLTALMRVWQVLHKGYEEVIRSPLPGQAAEMVLVRVAYLSDLPSAHDLLASLQGVPVSGIPLKTSARPETEALLQPDHVTAPVQPLQSKPSDAMDREVATSEAGTPAHAADIENFPDTSPSWEPSSFSAMLKVLQKAREPILYSHVIQDVHLISYSPGALTIRLASDAASTLPAQLRQVLERETGYPWIIKLADEGGDATISQQNKIAQSAEAEKSRTHPLVKSLVENFPGATITIK